MMTPDELAALVDAEGHARPALARIEAFEASINLRLPDDYKAFLALTPGGRPREQVVFSLAGEQPGDEFLRRVAGLRPDEEFSLERRHATASEQDIPQGLLSIMTDAGGNHIALALRPDRFGEVFFLDHEVSGGEGPPTLEAAESDEWGYAIRFALSFSEMVAGFSVVRILRP